MSQNKTLTILHSIDTGGPGGAESIFLRLASNFDDANFRAIAIAKSGGWVEQRMAEASYVYQIVDTQGSLNWRYLRQLVRLIRRHNVDIVHSHLFGSNLYCAVAGWLCNRPVISVFHGQKDLQFAGRLAGLKRMLVQCCSSKIIAVSEGLRTDLVKEGFPDTKKLQVILNGTDTEVFRPRDDHSLRSDLNIPDDAFLVGAVGNIRAPKAYDVFIEMASLLAARSSSYHFVIVGQGGNTLELRLRKQVRALGIEHLVRFLGYNSDPATVYSSLDVYVSSSDAEGFSLTCTEAMACGVPVVATRSGGPEEILTDRVTGRLVAPRDPRALSDAVETLRLDPEARRCLISAGRQHIETELSEHRMIENYKAIYAEVQKSSQG